MEEYGGARAGKTSDTLAIAAKEPKEPLGLFSYGHEFWAGLVSNEITQFFAIVMVVCDMGFVRGPGSYEKRGHNSSRNLGTLLAFITHYSTSISKIWMPLLRRLLPGFKLLFQPPSLGC